jgi:hypothetical protein
VSVLWKFLRFQKHWTRSNCCTDAILTSQSGIVMGDRYIECTMAVVHFTERGWKYISHSVYPFPVLKFGIQICPPKDSPHNLSFSSRIITFVISALCWRETVMYSELCSTYILKPHAQFFPLPVLLYRFSLSH